MCSLQKHPFLLARRRWGRYVLHRLARSRIDEQGPLSRNSLTNSKFVGLVRVVPLDKALSRQLCSQILSVSS